MTALVRKDLRLLRPLLLFAAGLAAFFYLLPVSIELIQWVCSGPVEVRARGYNEVGLVPKLAGLVFTSTQLIWSIGVVLLPAVGGMAFALERRERWSEFTAMLPVSRGRAVWAKLVASAVACGLMVWANELVAAAALVLRKDWPQSPYAVWPKIAWLGVAAGLFYLNYRRRSFVRLGVTCTAVVLIMGLFSAAESMSFYTTFGPSRIHWYWFWRDLMQSDWGSEYLPFVPLVIGMFGTAWLLSSLTRSPMLATAVAVAAVGGAYLWVVQTMNSSDLRVEAVLKATLPLRAGALVWGVLAVGAGVVVQLKRPTP